MSGRRPSPPAPLADVGHPPTLRLPGPPPIDDAVAGRIRDACADVTTPGADDGRDWWPLSVQWATSGMGPAAPGLVAHPTSAAEVADVLAVCADARVPVTPAAGRSGVCGGAVPVHGGVVLDLLGMAGITEVDVASGVVDVRPGTWGDRFEAELRDGHGLTAGHWPQSMAISTVGGWVACRGAGQYSTRYGKVEDMVTGLEVALADGSVIRTGGRAPRSATGPDLTQLFVGSEGTLGVVTSARFRVHPIAAAERRAVWAFPTFAEGVDACRRILRRGATPAVLRLYDRTESARHLPGVEGCGLLVLDEGDPHLVDAVLAVVSEECRAATVADPALVGHWLAHRNEVPSLASLAEAGIVADTVEVAARWSALPAIYEAAVAAVAALPATIAASGHQSHAYADGACLYFTFAGRPAGDAGGAGAAARPGASGGPGRSGRDGGRRSGHAAAGPAEAYYVAAWDALTEATLRLGGTLSHHHGIGINRGRHMERALDGAFPVLHRVKVALDPAGVLNPGKLGLASPWGPPPWP